MKHLMVAQSARTAPLAIAAQTPNGELDLIFETPKAWADVMSVGDELTLSTTLTGKAESLSLGVRGISASECNDGGRDGRERVTTVIATAADGLFFGARREVAEFIIENSDIGRSTDPALWISR